MRFVPYTLSNPDFTATFCIAILPAFVVMEAVVHFSRIILAAKDMHAELYPKAIF